MYVEDAIQMMYILVPAMAKAVHLDIPDPLTMPYGDMLDGVRNGVDTDDIVVRLYTDSNLDLNDAIKLVRMSQTLWAVATQVDYNKGK